MATTDVDIANKALRLISANAINQFDQSSTESAVASEVYEDIVQNCFTYPWRFATERKVMNRLSTAPISHWDAAYQLPGDPAVMNIESVTVADRVIPYDQIEDEIHCDAGSGDTVVLTYQYREVEDEWPPYFRLYVIYELATIFAASITRKEDIVKVWAAKAAEQYILAKSRDGRGVTPKRAYTRRLIASRGGGVWRRGQGIEDYS